MPSLTPADHALRAALEGTGADPRLVMLHLREAGFQVVRAGPARLHREPPLEVGSLRLDPVTCECFWGDHAVKIWPTPARFLHSVASRRGGVVTFDELRHEVYGGRVMLGKSRSAAFRVAVDRLRTAFCAVDPGFRALESVPHVGYRWDPSI